MIHTIAVLLCLAAPSSDPSAELLRSTNPNRRAPLWVAASTAAADNGGLVRESFESHELRLLQRATEARRARVQSDGRAAEPSCFGESPAEISARASSLNDLSSARAIVEGTITGRTLGFFEGRPGALLTVRVERTAQREGTFAIPAQVLVYYPEANFTVGEDAYCIHPATHPARPRIGDRVLVFAYGAPVDTTGRLLYVQASRHLVFETAGGRLLPPVALREEFTSLGLRSIADVVARLEQDGLRTVTRPRTAE